MRLGSRLRTMSLAAANVVCSVTKRYLQPLDAFSASSGLLKPRLDMQLVAGNKASCVSGQNEQLVDATSCLFEQQKVAPGDKLSNVEHAQL